LKDFLIKVCEANSTLKYSERRYLPKQADLYEVDCAVSASVERNITPNAENLTNLSNIDDLLNDISQTDVLFHVSKISDKLTNSNASIIKKLEDFIDKSFCNIIGLPDSAQPTDMSILHLNNTLMEI
jgi:hypothetical protein